MEPDIKVLSMEKCACLGSYLDKFLQPALLVLLAKGSSHGFKLLEDLEKSGMVSGDSMDPAGMYRTLKKMEAAGLVTSVWDVQTAAKPRRIYSISREGAHCLRTWQKTLRDYRSNIDQILTGIDGLIRNEIIK